MVVEEEEEEVDIEETNTKDLVRFLGMKDGVTASMASQGMLSDDCTPPVNIPQPHFPKRLEPLVAQASSMRTTTPATTATSASTAAAAAAASTRSSSIGSTPLDRIIQKQSSTDKKNS